MAKIAYFASYGSENPTKATMPFFLATGAIEAEHEPIVILGGEASVVIQDGIMDEIHGVGIPPLKGLIKQLVEHEVPIYV